MNELIQVSGRQIGSDTVQSVNARDLHEFLEVGKVFGAWIQDRIEQYGFTEGTDFVVFSDSGNNPKGGRPAKEYALTLDMAKELAMVERNDKGKQARQYFIECERRAKAAPLIPQSLPEALRLAADLADQKAKVEAALALAAPKVAALDRLATASEGAICLRLAAKITQVPEREYFKFLNQIGWIYRSHHSRVWLGYSDKERDGLIEMKKTPVFREDGSEKIVEQVLITTKGQAKVAELIEMKAPWLHKTSKSNSQQGKRT